MTARNYTVIVGDQTIAVVGNQLAHFREAYSWADLPRDRIAELLWVDIYVLEVAFGVSPLEILDTIRELERGDASSSGTKPATAFKNAPLKGLWHKHYFSAHFLLQNLALALGKNGVSKLVEEVMDTAKSAVITQDMIDELSRRVTHEPLEARDASKKLTGEWIVYLPRDGQNYYLCCNTHDAGDQFIYDRILEHCVRDFPALQEWLAAAAA